MRFYLVPSRGGVYSLSSKNDLSGANISYKDAPISIAGGAGLRILSQKPIQYSMCRHPSGRSGYSDYTSPVFLFLKIEHAAMAVDINGMASHLHRSMCQ